MHYYEEVEVWHATRRNKPARFRSLQVVQTANTSDWRERQWISLNIFIHQEIR